MNIWVDADACPRAIKEILYRAAERLQIPVTLVANRSLHTPPSPYVRSLRVPAGADVADNRIVQELAAGDLVVTADIPLAAAVIDRGAHALNPRGQLYTEDNVREFLAVRNLMDDLRGAGQVTGGPPTLRPNDRKDFADALDRFLSRHGPPRGRT